MRTRLPDSAARPPRTPAHPARYVRRLQKRYLPDPHLEPEEAAGGQAAGQAAAAAPAVVAAPGADPSLEVPVVFVSLLRKGTPDRDRSEAKLAAAFDAVGGLAAPGAPGHRAPALLALLCRSWGTERVLHRR
jgi:hypothetical protein